MKSLWNGIALFLLINLVAGVAFVAWLYQSGRLSSERIEKTVEVFKLTVEQEQKQLEEAETLAAKAEQEKDELSWKESVKAGPRSVQNRLDANQEARERQLQYELRREKDREALIDAMNNYKRGIEQLRNELEAQKNEFEQRLAAQAKRYKSENFGKAVRMYEQGKPKQVKSIFLDLIGRGQQNQVIEYLAAMQPRKAAAILKQFKNEAEIRTAASLIEGLRTRGVGLLTQDTTDQTEGVDG